MTNKKSVKEEFGNPHYAFSPEETIVAQTNWRDIYLALKRACDEAEPVGYRYVDHNGHWCFNEMKFGDIVEPVFTHPAPVIASEQKPVAWVDVIDRHEGPYNFNGLELLDSGKHLLFTSPPNTADIEQRVAEAWYDGNKFYANEESASMACADMANLEPLFTLPPTAEQIEQATAEACAKMIQGWPCTNGPSIAEAIRSGKWREYL